ncbi:MAG: methylmalonyl-CoA epimerase [Maricaulaceae bacterium]
MIGPLNHVGVATPSLEDAKTVYRDWFGATHITPTKPMPDFGVSVAFVSLPNAEIELLEPLGENSPIAKFLEKNPKGGQHHVCFEVSDLIAARDDLIAKGATALNNGQPRVGAHDKPVLFFHPRDFTGVLIELMEVSA